MDLDNSVLDSQAETPRDSFSGVENHSFPSGDHDPRRHDEELHSYLPGRLDPLFPKEFIRTIDESELVLPILQLDVILFPESTLPLRITEKRMVHFLSEKIASARNSSDSNMEIKLGIITKLKDRRRIPERIIHTNQAGMRQRMGRWPMMSLRGNFVPTRRDSLTSSSSDSSYEEDEERIHHRRNNNLRPEERSINYGRYIQEDPIIGRIGTVVTITNVYDSSNTEHEEIIITCFATKRFVIESREQDVLDHQTSAFVPTLKYRVSIFDDEPIPLCFIQKASPFLQKEMTSESNHFDLYDLYESRQKHSIRKLGSKVYLSHFVMNILYPSKVIDDIVHLINTQSSYASLKKMLLPVKDLYGIKFPYWLASNLPLSDHEKLHVLEASCRYQRLHFLLKLMERKVSIRCKQCRSNIASMGDVFSVSISAGVSGHYVNEYGAVHQTTTVSQIEDDSLACIGRPEVRDSWFAGYAWTIAVCKNCFEHIGWKFTLVEGDLECMDRPAMFWGLSGSQVI